MIVCCYHPIKDIRGQEIPPSKKCVGMLLHILHMLTVVIPIPMGSMYIRTYIYLHLVDFLWYLLENMPYIGMLLSSKNTNPWPYLLSFFFVFFLFFFFGFILGGSYYVSYNIHPIRSLSFGNGCLRKIICSE